MYGICSYKCPQYDVIERESERQNKSKHSSVGWFTHSVSIQEAADVSLSRQGGSSPTTLNSPPYGHNQAGRLFFTARGRGGAQTPSRLDGCLCFSPWAKLILCAMPYYGFGALFYRNMETKPCESIALVMDPHYDQATCASWTRSAASTSPLSPCQRLDMGTSSRHHSDPRLHHRVDLTRNCRGGRSDCECVQRRSGCRTTNRVLSWVWKTDEVEDDSRESLSSFMFYGRALRRPSSGSSSFGSSWRE